MTNAEVRRRYRERHPERVRAADRERTARKRAEQRDALNAAKRQERIDHPERVRERARRSRVKHRSAHLARGQRWRQENPTRARELARQAARRRRARQRGGDALALEYESLLRGDPCAYCGAPVEHVDHIEPILAGGAHEWANLTAACCSCNSSKQAIPLLAFMLRRAGA
jgi:hypothetical protein